MIKEAAEDTGEKMSHKEERITGMVKQQDELTPVKCGYSPPPVVHVRKPKPTPPSPPKKHGRSACCMDKTLI